MQEIQDLDEMFVLEQQRGKSPISFEKIRTAGLNHEKLLNVVNPHFPVATATCPERCLSFDLKLYLPLGLQY